MVDEPGGMLHQPPGKPSDRESLFANGARQAGGSGRAPDGLFFEVTENGNATAKFSVCSAKARGILSQFIPTLGRWRARGVLRGRGNRKLSGPSTKEAHPPLRPPSKFEDTYIYIRACSFRAVGPFTAKSGTFIELLHGPRAGAPKRPTPPREDCCRRLDYAHRMGYSAASVDRRTITSSQPKGA